MQFQLQKYTKQKTVTCWAAGGRGWLCQLGLPLARERQIILNVVAIDCSIKDACEQIHKRSQSIQHSTLLAEFSVLHLLSLPNRRSSSSIV